MAGMDTFTVVLGIVYFTFLNSMQRSVSYLVPLILKLNLICFGIGSIYFIYWLVYLGFTHRWYSPLILLLVDFVFNSTIMVAVEYSVTRIFKVDYGFIDIVLGLIGIVGVPICMVLSL